MNYFKHWYKEHKDYSIRSYADRILNIDLPSEFEKNNAVVLAACPNSGKTLMSIAWMDKYLLDNPSHRILVLTHGQTLLRSQFTNDIDESNVNFTYEEVTNSIEMMMSEEQVIITLPQTIISKIDEIDIDFDVLIVDEAHHYYFAEMIQSIIRHFNFKKQLLLTGTPAPFIARKMEIIAVSLEELFEGGFASDPIVVISKTNYEIKKADYNAENELKLNVNLSTEKTINTLDSLLSIIESKILKTGWKQSIETLGKTMFFCKNVSQAEDVHRYFKIAGVKSLLSTSYNDKSSNNIARFSDTNSDVNVLVVVDRGILGFNLPTLVNVIDMKCGKNISNLFQLFNRITRVHPNGNQKYFIKIVPEQFEEEFTYLLSAALSLMLKSNYIKYNGSNDEDVVVPTIKKSIKCDGDGKKKGKGKWNFEPIRYIDVPVTKMWKLNSNIIWNTLESIKRNLRIDNNDNRKWSLYTKDDNLNYCIELYRNKKTNCYRNEFNAAYCWIIQNNLLNKFNSVIGINIGNNINSFEKCIELYNNKKTNSFRKEFSSEYKWLRKNDLISKFNSVISKPPKHSIEKCIELYRNKKTNNFGKEFKNEYVWLHNHKKLNEFRKLVI